jgi:putative ABC transport system permease protein
MESMGMGMISFLLSVLTGTAVAIVLIRVINFHSFNWTIFYHHQWGPYLIAVGTAVLASIGAALYPIFKICRTYPQMQIREE